jgi:hypothetical protein
MAKVPYFASSCRSSGPESWLEGRQLGQLLGRLPYRHVYVEQAHIANLDRS